MVKTLISGYLGIFVESGIEVADLFMVTAGAFRRAGHDFVLCHRL